MPESGRTDTCCLQKQPGEVSVIFYAEAIGDFLNGKVGMNEQPFGLKHNFVLDIHGNVHSGDGLNNLVKINRRDIEQRGVIGRLATRGKMVGKQAAERQHYFQLAFAVPGVLQIYVAHGLGHNADENFCKPSCGSLYQSVSKMVGSACHQRNNVQEYIFVGA